MKIAVLLTVALLGALTWHAAGSTPVKPPTPVPIPRACSTPETSKYPFCDPSLSMDERIDDLVSRLNDDEKPPMLTARESPKGNVSRLGVPEYDWGANCVHGVQSRCGYKNNGTEWNCPTSFPNPVNLGASFNMSAVQAMGKVIGVELRSLWLQGVGENHGNNLPHLGLDCWSPNININRDPRWGRNQEVPGESPFLNGLYGASYSQGLQNGDDPRFLQAITTLKHWDAYSLESFGNETRHTFNAVVSRHMLADTYLPAFRRAIIEGGAKGVMCSYNALNGTPTCASSFLKTILRDTWKFTGYVTSDSGAVRDIYANHHFVDSPEAAACDAIRDGFTDINSGNVYLDHLINATAVGLCTMDDVDGALKRSLRMRFELGLFDPIDDQPYWHVPPEAVNTPESQALNLDTTLQSMTLLKNADGLLPLKAGINIAVIGPHADAQQELVGNYLGRICPPEDDGGTTYACITSPVAALNATNVGGVTTFTHGCDVDSNDTSGFDDAVAAAKAADVVILGIGLAQSVEGEGHDRTYVHLPGVQSALVKAVAAVGKPVVAFLLNGGMVAVDDILDDVDAMMDAFYPGYQGGVAIAKTLFGESSPSGKMPYTVYTADIVNQLNMFDMDMATPPGRSYRYYTGEPTFKFGHGLSYSRFSLSWANGEKPGVGHMNTTAPTYSPSLEYHVNVTNQGPFPLPAAEVVQAYFLPTHVDAGGSKLLKQMFGFGRALLAPGESDTAVFVIDPSNIQMSDPATGDLTCYPGTYTLQFTNGVDQTLEATLEVSGDPRVLVPFPVPPGVEM